MKWNVHELFLVTEVQDECENDGFIVDGDEDEEESKEDDDEKRDRKKWKKKRLIIFLNKQLILSR